MQKNKGITLVALVITIIILLILAGVAISMITGGDGLFEQANGVAIKYNQAAKNEADLIKQLLNGNYTFEGNGEEPAEPNPPTPLDPDLDKSNITFTYTPDTWTRGPVAVGINTKITGYTLEYSLNNGESWNPYEKELEVSENGQVILARLTDGERTGGIATGLVENIDKNDPVIKSFEITDVKSTQITCTVVAEDEAISQYEYYVNGKLLGASQSRTTITGLTPSTTYSIYVVVRDVAGNFTTSKTEEVTTLAGVDKQGPEIISVEAVNVSYKTFSIKAEAKDISDTDYISGIAKYEFYYGDTALVTIAENVTTATADITGGVPNNTYTMYVVVTDVAGNSTRSDDITITTLNGTDNLPPTNALLETVGVTNNSFTLVASATDVSDTDYVSGIARYDIYQDNGTTEGAHLGGFDSTLDTFTITINSASPGVTYKFWAIIKDASGNPVTTNTVTVTATTITGPDNLPPTDLSITYKDMEETTLTLVCEAKDVSDSDFISGIYSYELYLNGKSASVRTTSAERTEIPIVGLKQGSRYDFHMVVKDANGNSSTSDHLIIDMPVKSGTLLASVANLGDKVAYSANGYSNWRVLTNDGTTVTLISEGTPETLKMVETGVIANATTTTTVRNAANGFAQTLNNIAKKYINSTYATAARSVGTNASGDIHYATTIDVSGDLRIASLTAIGCDIKAGNITMGISDYTLPQDLYDMQRAGLKDTTSKYWLGSIYPGGVATVNNVKGFLYKQLSINSDGVVDLNIVMRGISNYATYGVRPVITLKNTVKVTSKDSGGKWIISN